MAAKKVKSVYLPTTKMILASLILSEMYKKEVYYAFCKDMNMKQNKKNLNFFPNNITNHSGG